MGRKFVSWRRVSTEKQSRSGLGLEDQKSIIEYFVNYEHGELIADYKECHTGTSLLTCTELKKAMEHCKREDACLIIAKVDRFRTVIEALQIFDYMGEGNVMFCDLPTSDRFSLTLYTAFAEREALLVSIRTKQALAALKARGGVKLGAANDKYVKNRQKKDKNIVIMEARKRGETRRLRYQQSKDVQAFLKILRHEFPSSTDFDNPSDWVWEDINTKNGKKHSIISLMKTAKELDETGKLFTKWDFTKDDRALLCKLCSYLATIKSTFKKNNI